MEITVPIAFLAGILSFISPCILPLILPYISYISGISISTLKSGEIKGKEKRKLILATLYFIFGFTTIFILFGVIAGQIGGILISIKEWIGRIGGVLIILLGLHMVGIIRIPFLDYEKRVDIPSIKSGYFTSFIVGMLFAFGWTPCIGPVLGSIIGIAMYEGNSTLGAILLGAYSLGLGTPFFLTSLFVTSFIKFISRHKKIVRISEIVGGIIIIFIGTLLLFSSVSIISSLIIKIFPFLSTLG